VLTTCQTFSHNKFLVLWGEGRGEQKAKAILYQQKLQTLYDMDMGLKKGEMAYKNGAGKK
jgi:hypothetical protein